MLRLFESTFESKEKRENSLSCSILCSRRQMPHSAAADLPVGKPLGWGVSLKRFGIYIAINLSCPNTKEGKTFEDPESLEDLICALKENGKKRPVVFKFSPGLERY